LPSTEFVKLIQGRAAPEHIEAVKNASAELARAGNNDPGSVRYAIYQAKDDPALFTVFGRWRNAAEFDNYIASDYHQKFIDVLPAGAWAVFPKSTVLEPL
jgi:quinol monooxygenase YgiN